MTGDDDWFSENLKKRPKLLNAHVPAEAKRWVAAIDYAEPRTWLRRGTSTQTILCAIKAAGEAHCLFAKIEGKGKTGVTVVIGVSDLKGVKLEKCQKAWYWQVEIVEAIFDEFLDKVTERG
jgi:hypothetical protein